MNVIGYDPFLPAGVALKAGITVNNNLDEIFPVADYITLHVPLTDDTRKMICTESIDKMKNTVRVLNFARGDLADSQAIVDALEEGKMAAYVTDFPKLILSALTELSQCLTLVQALLKAKKTALQWVLMSLLITLKTETLKIQ